MTIGDVLTAIFIAYGSGVAIGLLVGGVVSQFNDIFR